MTACKWNNEEELCFNLQKLYGGFGYQRYKMGKFEEYSLYLDNKNFLKSQSVITFNDHGGKLMALKPDVTLSIVKNAAPGQPRKVYYKESVYRPDKTTGEFREISQIGLELLGGVDDVATAEVLFLAAKSLEEIDAGFLRRRLRLGAQNRRASGGRNKISRRFALGVPRGGSPRHSGQNTAGFFNSGRRRLLQGRDVHGVCRRLALSRAVGRQIR